MKRMMSDARALLRLAGEVLSYLCRILTRRISPEVARVHQLVASHHDDFHVMHHVNCARLALPPVLLAHDVEGLWIDRAGNLYKMGRRTWLTIPERALLKSAYDQWFNQTIWNAEDAIKLWAQQGNVEPSINGTKAIWRALAGN